MATEIGIDLGSYKTVIFSGSKKRYELYLKNRNNNDLFFLPKLYDANQERLYIVEEFLAEGV